MSSRSSDVREHLIALYSANDPYSLRFGVDINSLAAVWEREGLVGLNRLLERKLGRGIDMNKNLGSNKTRVLRIIQSFDPQLYSHIAKQAGLSSDDILPSLYDTAVSPQNRSPGSVPRGDVIRYVVNYVNQKTALKRRVMSSSKLEKSELYQKIYYFFLDNDRGALPFSKDFAVFAEDQGMRALNILLKTKFGDSIPVDDASANESHISQSFSNNFSKKTLKPSYKTVRGTYKEKLVEYFEKVDKPKLDYQDLLFTWLGFLKKSALKKLMFRIYGRTLKIASKGTLKSSAKGSSFSLHSHNTHKRSSRNFASSHVKSSHDSSGHVLRKKETLREKKHRKHNTERSMVRSPNPFEENKAGFKVRQKKIATLAKPQKPGKQKKSTRSIFIDVSGKVTEVPSMPPPGAIKTQVSSKSILELGGSQTSNHKKKVHQGFLKVMGALKFKRKNKGILISDLDELTFEEDRPVSAYPGGAIKSPTVVLPNLQGKRIQSEMQSTALNAIMNQSMSTKLNLLKGDDFDIAPRVTSFDADKIILPLPNSDLAQEKPGTILRGKGPLANFSNLLRRKKKAVVVCGDFELCTDEYSPKFGKCATCGYKKTLHMGESFDENEVQSESGGRACRRFVGAGNFCDNCTYEKTRHQWFAFDLPDEIRDDGLSFEDI